MTEKMVSQEKMVRQGKLHVRQKKQTRNESIKSCKETLERLINTYQMEPEFAHDLEEFSKLFASMLKTLETVKKTRNNANTGLGKNRPVTAATRAFIKQVSGDDNDNGACSRSVLTSLISRYVKEKQLQTHERKTLFQCDEALCSILQCTASMCNDAKKLEKYLELECIQNRAYMQQYIIGLLESGSTIELADELKLRENDLISWTELQKILFLTFEDEQQSSPSQ
jgi:hypothetical protein